MPATFLRFTLVSVLFLSFISQAKADCVDTVLLKINPVQCYGLRNGSIEILEVAGGISPFYYSLDGSSYSTRPLFDLLWAGEYVLHVRDSSGCVKKFQLLVPEPDELKVKLSISDTSVVAGEIIQLKATVMPAGSVLTAIQWRPPDMFTAQHQLSQIIRAIKDTDFAIEVTNANGCEARDNLSMVVEKTNLYFPNIFSPGSNQNNYFTLFSGEGVSQIRLLRVYNRAGQLMFEQRDFQPNDPLRGWNGKAAGRLAAAGVYTWAAVVEFADGHQEQFSGNVTLMN